MATFTEVYRSAQKLQLEKSFDEALVKFQEAAALKPQDVTVLYGQVQCYTQLGRHEEAIALAKEICERAPDDHFSWMTLSRAYQPAGMIPEAEEAMWRGQTIQQQQKS